MKISKKAIIIIVIILVLLLVGGCLLLYRYNSDNSTNSGNSGNSSNSELLTKSESKDLSKTLNDFFTELKQANPDITKYMATDENTEDTEDHSRYMIDDETLHDWDEMQQEKLKFLLKNLAFEKVDLKEQNGEDLEKGEATDIYVVINLKAWDDYAPMELLKYMLEQGEFKYDNNKQDGTTSNTNEENQLELLKKIENNIPEKDIEFTLTVYHSKDGGYVIDDQHLFRDMGIIETYDEFGSTIYDITDASDIKTINEEQLGENQAILLQMIKEYNNMLEQGEYDFDSLYAKYTNIKDRYGKSDESKLEEIQKYISWYNGLTGDEKEKANEILKETGQIEFAIYGIYNTYSGELKETRIACLSKSLLDYETKDYYYDFFSRSEEGVIYTGVNIFNPLYGAYLETDNAMNESENES